MKIPISVCILSKNSEKTLEKTLESTKNFDEVLILDTGSTDQTLEITKKFSNVHLHQTPFTTFGPLRNLAAHLAKNAWILALDSDEILSKPLIEEIAKLPLQSQTCYGFLRHNFYNHKRIRSCGWDPDIVYRLYHKKHTAFKEMAVHESLICQKQELLCHPLLHTPYHSTQDFLQKMQHYSTLFAQENAQKVKSSFSKALLHASFAFFRSYILKKGVLDGKEGFLISLYNTNTTFYKYLKLAEENKKYNHSPM